MNYQNNISKIKIVHDSLGELKDKVVFVGGTIVPLYAEKETFEARFTLDVDVIIEVLSYAGHAKLEEQLAKMGFTHDIESKIICRYIVKGIIVDIMPTTNSALGFSNKWYPDGFKKAIDLKIDDKNTIKIMSAPYFIATKLEAFKSRGNGDGRTSQDFEDIIYILENRQSIYQEITNLSGDLKEYLIEEFKKLMQNPNITEWIDSNVERGSPPATYMIIDQINKMIE